MEDFLVNNKEPKTSDISSYFSGFMKDVVTAGVFGALIFAMPLLHDAIVGGTPTSNPFHWALVGGGVTFVGLLAFLQLPTKLFVYVIPVLVLVVAFIKVDGPELKDATVQPEVPVVVQPEVPVVAQPIPVQPEVPTVIEPDTTLVQPETTQSNE